MERKEHSVIQILLVFIIYFITGAIVRDAARFWLMKVTQSADEAAVTEVYLQRGIGVWVTGITALIVIGILFVWMHREDAVPTHSVRMTSPLEWILLVPLGICTAMGLNQLFSLLPFSGLYEGYETTKKVLFSGSTMLSALVLGILVPVCEELMFRGMIFSRLQKLCKPKTAILFSALLFGMYHMNLLQFLYATLVGLLLAAALERMCSILAPMILHSVANLFVYLAGGLSCFQTTRGQYLTCAAGLAGMGGLIWFYSRKKSNNLKQI